MDKNYVHVLQTLAKQALEDLDAFPKPIVRVSGTLTSCEMGEEDSEKRKRIKHAQIYLQQQGLNVFNYDKYLDTFCQIYEPYMHGAVIHYFHEPILRTNVFETVYFLPEWRESRGAVWESNFIKRIDTNRKMFSKEWFDEVLTEDETEVEFVLAKALS